MENNEFTAKTIDEAIEEGLSALNITKEEADIIILEEPSKGFLGMGGKKAKIQICKKMSDGERAIKFVESLIAKMNFSATAELVEEGEKIIINLVTTNSSALIGYRGEVLDAFQCLAGAVANIGRDEYKRVVVNCENYREKREETLKNLANRIAQKAIEKGRKISLEPMNPYERRIIHAALSENTEVKTISEGKEPNRFIAIIPNNIKHFERKKFDPTRKPYNRDDKTRKPYNKDNYKREGNYNKESSYRRDDKESSLNEKPIEQKKKTLTYGTFIGNNLK